MATAGLVTTAVTWILWGIIVICGIVLTWIIVTILRFKHKIRIRIITGSKKFIKDDKFRIVHNKDGNRYLMLMKRRHKLPLPPPESIDLIGSMFGTKMCVEVYYTEEGEYKYIKDDKEVKEVKGLFSKFGAKPAKATGTYAYISDQNTHIKSFAPLDTDQRLLLIDGIAKANARKGISWMQYTPLIASGMVLVIIFVLALAFWEDITAPSLKAQKVHLEVVKETNNLMQTIDRIDKNTQHIGGSSPPDLAES